MSPYVHRLSIVVPVYRGATTLPRLIEEILPLTVEQATPDGHRFAVTEVLPVWDNGPDESDVVMRRLAEEHSIVKPVWLSRNQGQHPATMAGMASAGGDWIVTMDEDGQHDPAAIPGMLDVAMREQARVVYARATNPPPHGVFRNWASRTSKKVLAWTMGNDTARLFNSYRLVLGETGRALAAYAGPGVYLDVALGWITNKVVTAPVAMRGEDRPSGYSFSSLLSHFLRMIVTSGTRGLRVVTVTGILLGVLGVLATIALVVHQLVAPAPVAGWASMMCVLMVTSGLVLAAIGVVAEYLGVVVNSAMGKPLYLIVPDPAHGPLGQPAASPTALQPPDPGTAAPTSLPQAVRSPQEQ